LPKVWWLPFLEHSVQTTARLTAVLQERSLEHLQLNMFVEIAVCDGRHRRSHDRWVVRYMIMC